MTTAAGTGAIPPRHLLYLALISLLPLFSGLFAEGNHVEQLPIILRLLDPGFAAGDVYVESATVPGQPRYYFAAVVAALATVAPLHIVIHALTVLCGFVLGLATFLAVTRALGASALAGSLAATLAVLNAGFTLGLAGYLTFESFQPANPSIAASILGAGLLLMGRPWLALSAFLFAAAMHPTLGAEVAVIAYAATALATLVHGRHRDLVALVGSGVAFLIGFAVLWVLPNLGGDATRIPDETFFDILIEFRAPHHYLGLDMPRRRWFEALGFLAAFGAIFAVAWRLGLPRRALTSLALIVAAIYALIFASLWFVDIGESRLWATAQVFRNLLFAKWAAYLLIGWLAARWIDTRAPAWVILAVMMILPALDAHIYALVAALATAALLSALKLKGPTSIAATLPAMAVALYHMDRYGANDQMLRIMVALAALWLLALSARPLAPLAAAALVALFLAVGIVTREDGLLGQPSFAGSLTFEDHQDDAAEIARAASEIGPEGSIWLIPPNLEQFRILSRKAVVVDFTSIPFSDAGLLDWYQRMTGLYGEVDARGFAGRRMMLDNHRSDPQTGLAHDRYGADYAVLFADTPWPGEVLAENEAYKIVRIAP